MAMLGRLMAWFITILVGVSLIPSVANQVYSARYPTANCTGASCVAGNTSSTEGNVTGASSTITNLITLFFSLGVLTAGISLTIGGLKDAGLV